MVARGRSVARRSGLPPAGPGEDGRLVAGLARAAPRRADRARARVIRPILRHPDSILRRRCAPVGPMTDEVRALAADMLETMYAAPGRGLAAPQVGVPTRLFVMDVSWREGPAEPMVFVDPEVARASEDRVSGVEACLSIPDRPMRVERPVWVDLRWRDLDGAPREGRLEDARAVCAQHELDHLDGRLILDHGEPVEASGDPARALDREGGA